MTDAIYRSNKANAARRLRNALVAKIDKDEDGVLNDSERERAIALGLDPDQLFAKPFRYDLDEIVVAAQRAGLVSPSYTARAIRNEAWRAAQAETEEIMAPERDKTYSMIAWYRVPNYLEWATWQHGAKKLFVHVRYSLFFLIGNPSHWVPFFMCVYLAGLIVCLLLRGRRLLAAGLVSVAVFLGVMLITHLQWYRPAGLGFWPLENAGCWAFRVPYFLLILAAAISGVRRAGLLKKKWNALPFALLVLGLVLMAWGLAPGLKRTFYGYLLVPYPYVMGIKITLGARIGIVASGAVAFATGSSSAIIRTLRQRTPGLAAA